MKSDSPEQSRLEKLQCLATGENYSVDEFLDGLLDLVAENGGLQGLQYKLDESKRSASRLDLRADVARIAWWEMDAVTGQVRYDPRKAIMAGYAPEHFEGCTYHAFTELIHPDDYEATMQAMLDLLEGRADSYIADYRLKRADGGWIWFHDRGQISRQKDGSLIIYGFVLDIDERKRAEEQKFQIKLEQERLHMLRQFIQSAAHEFRTPLATIGLNAHLLSHIESVDQQKLKIKKIENQVDHINKLVNMLLYIVELESKSLELEPVNIWKIFQRVCDIYRVSASRHVIFELPPELPPVKGEKEFLRLAVDALLDNAQRFSPPESPVTVQGGLDTTRQQVVISVMDEGQGILAEDMPHIFETFWRKDPAHTTPGLGLGLPLVQKVVNMCGGKITVESESGKGSIFTLYLTVF